MGVPAFYRWLSEKYPKIVQDLLEQRDNVIDGTVVPINLNEPNPNGYAHIRFQLHFFVRTNKTHVVYIFVSSELKFLRFYVIIIISFCTA
jgi:hypothetical protein